MSSKTMARMSRRAEVPPVWTSVLAVIAHPDDASVGLGSVLDAFVFAVGTNGTTVGGALRVKVELP